MNKLRVSVYESNAETKDQILEVVEEVICDVLKKLDTQASMLCDKHDGAAELSHYYAGKGMTCREVAIELGFDVDWETMGNQ